MQRLTELYDKTLGFFFWWLLYHGNENPIKLYKEEKQINKRLKELGIE